MPEHQARVAGAGGLRRLDVLLLAQREVDASNDAGGRRPEEEDQDERDAPLAALPEQSSRGEQDGEKGQRQHEVRPVLGADLRGAVVAGAATRALLDQVHRIVREPGEDVAADAGLLLDPSDVGMLEDLVTAAVNEALSQVQEFQMGQLGGLGRPSDRNVADSSRLRFAPSASSSSAKIARASGVHADSPAFH